ncbi:hypothetical protein [Riemerella anatipestifer]|uniref:Uncharacterized protein n=1 Tax=Riemerella anatipestifer TaxID=34085 RepID=A0A1S7DV55_RIEAN|nr:hypothetical protein [Riemerella anatipestifer]AQY22989.1 hypothetical protein AB406_2049 [Riemerella anatipestifer]MBT0556833.1 hypothetical protein [Riemerella anatipestifer]MCO7355756.1 hypothetical protein [Riemerella anatipestifer]MDY3351878.1 hypothetical protein [Riemerella anatipestifer]MDY3525061.1 hypothetical protein [Riemerella anatipestifer]
MKDLYKKIVQTFDKEEIKQLYLDKNIPPVEFIDLYAEQDVIPEWFEAHHYPALLFGWSVNHSVTPAVADITIHLCYEQLHDTSNLGTNTELALKFFEFIEITDNILKKIETKHTGKLNLVTEENKIAETVVDTYTLRYQCSYTKTKASQNENLRGKIDDISIKKGLFSKLLD